MEKMYKLLFLFSLMIWGASCGSEESGEILSDFPKEYVIDSINVLKANTYYFTDSIIYKINNDFNASTELRDSMIIDSVLFNKSRTTSNFAIQSIVFTAPSKVTINTKSGSSSVSYSELSGIGTVQTLGGLGFKINPDLNQLLSCFTITSKRNIDSLFEGSFLPGLDTLYNDDSTFIYQLNIMEGEKIELNYCNPVKETDLVRDFATRNGLVNNDRIFTHRTDFIFVAK